jgi:hypothetical protein
MGELTIAVCNKLLKQVFVPLNSGIKSGQLYNRNYLQNCA